MEEAEVDTEGADLLALLQPQRDLVANWSVDVARELQQYLEQLSRSCLCPDGRSLLNFAQAALVIQGSIQVYSRKVEYLYGLVLQALELIALKKASHVDGKSPLQVDGKDTDVFEEEEEEFLNLDDVPEEANIDIDDHGSGSGLLTPVLKPPACLLVVEGDVRDMAGDAGELASFQIATSILHRDFLLLDPCDTASVDIYLGCAARKSPAPRVRGRTPKGTGTTTPAKRQNSVVKDRTPKSAAATHGQGGEDGAHANKREQGAAPEQPNVLDSSYWPVNSLEHMYDDHGDAMPPNEASVSDSETESDPWAALNPYEVGSLPIKPFKKGDHFRKIKPRRESSTTPAFEVCVASRHGPSFPEFGKILQAKLKQVESETSDDGWSRRFEQLRSTYCTLERPKPGSPDKDTLDEGAETANLSDEDDQCNETRDAVPEDDFVFQHVIETTDANIARTSERGESDLGPLPDWKDGETEEMSFEELCQAHMDSIFRKLVDSEERTELAARVSGWKQKIEVTLEEQESRTPFDIHIYGEKLLQHLSSTTDVAGAAASSQEDKSFADLVRGQPEHEVARSFSALLQLVNNGNVDIDRSDMSSPCSSQCFTADDSFKVKLLSGHRQHEEMLQYVAPSRTKSKKEPRAALQNISNNSLGKRRQATPLSRHPAENESPTPGSRGRRKRPLDIPPPPTFRSAGLR